MAQYLCIWVRAYWFSVTSFSKWLLGGHIRFFRFLNEWYGLGSVTQVCFGFSVSNFMCMSLVAVDRSLTIVSFVAFKIGALWFWTMFNCNPPIAHCHPLLWGGGILVDHWSTISSYISDTAVRWYHLCVTPPEWVNKFYCDWFVTLHKLHGILSITTRVMMVISFTWICMDLFSCRNQYSWHNIDNYKILFDWNWKIGRYSF